METKKTQQRGTAKDAQKKSQSVSVRIDRLVDLESNRLKAVASANLQGGFAVHGIKVMDSDKGLFVSMPQSKYQKDGKTEYSDIFHPVTAEARTELNNAVLEAYEQKLVEEQAQDMEGMKEAEKTSAVQSM